MLVVRPRMPAKETGRVLTGIRGDKPFHRAAFGDAALPVEQSARFLVQ